MLCVHFAAAEDSDSVSSSTSTTDDEEDDDKDTENEPRRQHSHHHRHHHKKRTAAIPVATPRVPANIKLMQPKEAAASPTQQPLEVVDSKGEVAVGAFYRVLQTHKRLQFYYIRQMLMQCCCY